MNAATIHEAERVLAELERRRERHDPVSFARRLRVGGQTFSPDTWQTKFLVSDAGRRIFNVSRQCGKSTIAAISAAHGALYARRRLTLCVSPSERQSKELLRKIRDFLRQSGAVFVNDSKTELELDNGCRVVSLPASEDTIRNYSADLIIEDEAGYVSDAVHVAILPMIAATHGDLVLMSTPNGRTGHFFDAWERGGEDWERYEVKAIECPRIDLHELDKQRRALGASFAQEYEGSFIGVAAGLVYCAFDEQTNLLSEPPKPLDDPSWRFMLGVDFGFHDACAFVVVGYLPGNPHTYVLQSYKETGMLPPECAEYVRGLPFRFSRIIGDEGGLGKGYAESMRRYNHIPVEPAEKTNKAGYIDLINGHYAEGLLRIVRPSNRALIEEIVTLPWADNKKHEADGFDNHLTDALLYVWRASTAYLTKPVVNTQTPAQQAAQAIADARYAKFAKYHDAPRHEVIDPILREAYE